MSYVYVFMLVSLAKYYDINCDLLMKSIYESLSTVHPKSENHYNLIKIYMIFPFLDYIR